MALPCHTLLACLLSLQGKWPGQPGQARCHARQTHVLNWRTREVKGMLKMLPGPIRNELGQLEMSYLAWPHLLRQPFCGSVVMPTTLCQNSKCQQAQKGWGALSFCILLSSISSKLENNIFTPVQLTRSSHPPAPHAFTQLNQKLFLHVIHWNKKGT